MRNQERRRETLLFVVRMIKAIKGTKDILPEEINKWHLVEKTAREVFALYGYQEIRTPIFEETELFARSIGQETDIVAKEMYTFTDKSDKSITLRPEATASVVRAYIEHHMDREGGIKKLYYIGPMFRHERPQKGRYRQFHQIGAEVLGSDHPAIEAEVIEMLLLFLERLKIWNTSLLINSIGCAVCRPKYIELLREEVAKHFSAFCEDCKRRSQTNPLRILDCKVESCQPLIEKLPTIADHLCEACAAHFAKFRELLQQRGIAYTGAPKLVRGLDYYVRTVFEITSPGLGSQNAVVGGGRYDGLAELLGGPPTKGLGFALGIERLISILSEDVTSDQAKALQLFLAPVGEDAFDYCALLAKRLREQGIRCYLDFDARSLKSQMRLADKLAAVNVLIVGDEELKNGHYTLKRMSDSAQMKLTESELIQLLHDQQNANRKDERYV